MGQAMRLNPQIALALAAAAMVAGCASGNGRYPSLEIRPGERVAGVVEPVAGESPAPPPAASAELLARLAQLEDEAAAAHARFTAAAPRARTLADASQGAEVESDAWAAAQVALADLDSQRSLAATALGDLDLLYAEATLGMQARDQIDAARERIIALLREEDRQLAELRARVG